MVESKEVEQAREKQEESEIVHKLKRGESNLVPCKECGKLISPDAEKCPNCGAITEAERQRATQGCWSAIVVFIILLALLLIFVGPCLKA